MENAFQKYFYTNWYAEDLEWLKNDLIFCDKIQKPEVKEMYKKHIEWQLEQLEVLKTKIKKYE